jgi:hypothetical protein
MRKLRVDKGVIHVLRDLERGRLERASQPLTER